MNNKLLTRITSVSEWKQMFIEILINNTSKVSKVSDESVLNAIAYGVAKIAQKQNKDAAILESQIFPEFATGDYLDTAAFRIAGLVRLSAANSSTFIRVKATQGTTYIQGVNNFVSKSGVQFEVTSNVVIGSLGYGYIPIRSINVGENTNVSAQTITTVTPSPVGHISCLNEYAAIGGRDTEDDESFKLRVLSLPNIVAKGTLSNVLEILRKYNPNILRLFKYGFIDGKIILSLVTENGVFLTQSELDSLIEDAYDYLPITVTNEEVGIKLENVEWKYIDLDFRIDYSDTYSLSEIRQNIQINITKYLDFRYWIEGSKVQWDDILETVRRAQGVKYVPDEYFSPRQDISTYKGQLPRIRGFVLRDMLGNILFDSGVALTPVFYQQ